MLENEKDVLDALIPRLVKNLRDAVPKEPYEIAFERIVEPAASEAHLSRQGSYDLRKAVEQAYRELSAQYATLPKGPRNPTGKISGRIPRHSTAEERKALYSPQELAAGAEAEDRHDEIGYLPIEKQKHEGAA